VDLGKCPKCGVVWPAGNDRCNACGYKAIGAGLDKLPKKVKPKRPVKYKEPGSATPLLTVAVLAGLGYIGYVEKPWTNNFEFIRVLFGAEPSPHIEGDWNVTKILSMGKSVTPITSAETSQGTMKFHSDKSDIVLNNGTDEPFKAKAKYVQNNDHVILSDFTTDPVCEMPPKLDLNLCTYGPDKLIAVFEPSGAIHLQRMTNSEAVAKALSVKLLAGKDAGAKGGDDE